MTTQDRAWTQLPHCCSCTLCGRTVPAGTNVLVAAGPPAVVACEQCGTALEADWEPDGEPEGAYWLATSDEEPPPERQGPQQPRCQHASTPNVPAAGKEGSTRHRAC
jgi:hypothetical protein